ncbi:MAG TPA: ATPase domain-containing protein [Gemmatimonadaceae bacterium]|nr:ATPase domain-containing protein [Gemmatimonadaceae bacterium]
MIHLVAQGEAFADRPLIGSLPTGVPGFDAVLRGGLPEFSFNLLAGGPGVGKTTLAQQMVFNNATVERPALYFTVLGEPTLKMIRYQRQFRFFRPELVGTAVRFINLTEEVLRRDLTVVLQRIVDEVERATPALVVVDSFRTIGFPWPGRDVADAMGLEQFVQRLALHLTTWEVTSFLIGEYAEPELQNPIFTVADGIVWMSQASDRNSVVRKLQVVKARGRAMMPGLHTFRMTEQGIQVFPRIPEQQEARRPRRDARLATGVPGLDAMMGGGYPAGDAVLLTGPAGSGKTTFATQFLAEGLRRGEAGVAIVFEEYPEAYLARAKTLDIDLAAMIERQKLSVLYLRPLDLSVDETLAAILEEVERLGATRVVIDSLSGFEVALAPTFREDFRESLYRLVGALTATGVTVVMTAETPGTIASSVTLERVSFITDDIIVQRYVEIAGELRPVLAVAKMRGSAHSRDYRAYEITARGAVVGKRLTEYHGITTGVPDRPRNGRSAGYAGLTERESGVLDVLIRLREASPGVLATQAGVADLDVVSVLQRLVTLDYASEGGAPNERMYRAVAQGEHESDDGGAVHRRNS